MYGQTEATARMSFLDPKFLGVKPASIGKPILNGSFYLTEYMNELCYKGPNVFGGYAEDIKDLQSFDLNQDLKTGDIATIDDEGFYYITGRIKRFVKIVGSRINLDEVEAMLKNEFHGVTFYCMGFRDKYILVVTGDSDFERNRIINHLSNELTLHKSFIKTAFMEHIPLTENGKINYTLIQQQYDSE
jgi:acyl-CoA synthetase (AMP-forming)/AMP-acid ligase II